MSDTKSDSFIPQIKPSEEKSSQGVAFGQFQNSSILLPKITPSDNPSTKVVEDKPQNQSQKMQDLNQKPKGKRFAFLKSKLFIAFTLAFIILIVIASLFVNLYLSGKALTKDAQELKASIDTQNLTEIKKELNDFESGLRGFQKSYALVSWMKFVPFLGTYIDDGIHVIKAGLFGLETAKLTIDAIEPYSDLLGFSSDNTQAIEGETASERIDFIAESLPAIIPKLDEISKGAESVKFEFSYVNPQQYPVRLGKYEVRSNVEKALDSINEVTRLITEGKPLIENSPYLLGLDEPRTYLVIFQNDKELRPTGGFITAYSIMKVDKARFEPVSSDDIYHLDAKYKPTIPAPDPIIDYLKGPYVLNKNLRLRDMNWNPDFQESMEIFLEEAEDIGIDEIDGVVAVDTQALVYLLDVLGSVDVPGFGHFSNEIVEECNCPQVIYELESFADVEGPIVWDPAGTGKIVYQPPNADNRKKIIGPLMNSIFAYSMGQPKEKIPSLFESAFKSLLEKHVILYMHDDDVQKAVSDFGIGGRVIETENDYLSIIDANLGGRKSNLYVTQEVYQDITVEKDGTVTKKVEIVYKNPEEFDGWLNSILPNWSRIYIPKGSEVIKVEGFEESVDPFEELGKTVIAGYFELRPQGVTTINLEYKLPFKVKGKYLLNIQKQSGTHKPLHTIKLGKYHEEFFLDKDTLLNIKI